MPSIKSLNSRAAKLCHQLQSDAEVLHIRAFELDNGTHGWDFGVHADGGLEAGRRLAEICLAGLGEVRLQSGVVGDWRGPLVTVATDHPVRGCMASQYAGWRITHDRYFAMGSGPMRAAAGVEPLFEQLALTEQGPEAVGVLETDQLPDEAVAAKIASACGVSPDGLHLCVARTASLAGTLQIVARSVETAVHQLWDLQYDLKRIHAGFGSAPLPPVAADDLVGIGRTNDAILYGAEVTLWLRDDDDALAELAEKIPSCASPDFGEPFAQIFERYDHDFYKIDPHLFSPAVIRLNNLNSGRTFFAGQLRSDVLRQSFGS